MLASALPGVIWEYAGNTAPAGFLMCYGQAVSRATYPHLFAVIGTTFGQGDGATTFNVPDMRGRAAIGRDDMGGTAANRMQASTTVTTTLNSNQITVASAAGLTTQMTVAAAGVPAGATITGINGATVTLSVNATATANNVAARFSLMGDAQAVGSSGGTAAHQMTTAQMPAHSHNYNRTNDTATGAGSYGGNATNTAASSTTGGDQPHPNVQPSIIINKIIKY